jgi:hypothetical protein
MQTKEGVMSKRKDLALDEDNFDEVVFVKYLPARGSARRAWYSLLEPCLKNPNRWARIHVADNPDQAANAASNLNKRNIRIPNPEHDWSFASRGMEVYANYRGGPKRRGSVRRAKGA